MAGPHHQLVLTPHGRLLCEALAATDAPPAEWAEIPPIHKAFANSSAHGLLALAAWRKASGAWPADSVFGREFAGACRTKLAHAPEPAEGRAAAKIGDDLAGAEVVKEQRLGWTVCLWSGGAGGTREAQC